MRSARGEAILRVIAMRYAPQLIVSQNEGVLLANLLQRSRSTFSWESFLSFFTFQEGMLDTQNLALEGWPTVSGR
jgi:hypothetical protein